MRPSFSTTIALIVFRKILKSSTGVSLKAFGRFRTLALEADIIHYHFPWPFADIVHFATSTSKPTVLTYHSDIIRQQHLLMLYRPLMKRFLRSVDRIVATSPNYLETSDILRDHSGKTDVIPIGLDRSTYPDADDGLTAKWRQELGDRSSLSEFSDTTRACTYCSMRSRARTTPL